MLAAVIIALLALPAGALAQDEPAPRCHPIAGWLASQIEREEWECQDLMDLHAKGNTVGCYASVGTCEDWRDDYGDMAASCVDKAWAAWEGEYFVDQVDDALLAVMQARFETMAG